MSELRKQLERAKADYESTRYPGDLATDMDLLRRPTVWRVLLPLAPWAVAASVLVAIAWVWSSNSGNDQLTQGVQHQSTTVPGRVAMIFDNGISPTTAPSYDTPAVAERPAAESIPEPLSFPTDMPSMPTDGLSSFPAPTAMPSLDQLSDTSLSEKEPV